MDGSNVLIFTRTKRTADALTLFLRQDGDMHHSTHHIIHHMRIRNGQLKDHSTQCNYDGISTWHYRDVDVLLICWWFDVDMIWMVLQGGLLDAFMATRVNKKEIGFCQNLGNVESSLMLNLVMPRYDTIYQILSCPGMLWSALIWYSYVMLRNCACYYAALTRNNSAMTQYTLQWSYLMISWTGFNILCSLCIAHNRSGQAPLMVATDVASRGLGIWSLSTCLGKLMSLCILTVMVDVKNIRTVINFEMPQVLEVGIYVLIRNIDCPTCSHMCFVSGLRTSGWPHRVMFCKECCFKSWHSCVASVSECLHVSICQTRSRGWNTEMNFYVCMCMCVCVCVCVSVCRDSKC